MIELDLQLDRPDFRLQAKAQLDGAITGLIGHSGSGKTTLLHLIAGLHRPTHGYVRLDGDTLSDAASHTHRPPHRRGVGLVFQDARLLPHRSVRANLGYGRRRRGERGAASCTPDDVARWLAIDHLLDRRPRDLSGGEKQRVAIGRALLSRPRLLLLDEPWAALDQPMRQRMIALIRHVHVRTGVPMIIVSHQLPELLQLTDRLALMDHGCLTGAGTLQSLLRDPSTNATLREHGPVNVVPMRLDHRIDAATVALRPPHRMEPARRFVSAPMMSLGDAKPGDAVQMMLRPQDIALALAPVEHITMQNQLPGTIRTLVALPHLTLCEVDVGFPLVTEVSHQARRDFALHEGKRVWALFKTQTVRISCAARAFDRSGGMASTLQPEPVVARRGHDRSDAMSDMPATQSSPTHELIG